MPGDPIDQRETERFQFEEVRYTDQAALRVMLTTTWVHRMQLASRSKSGQLCDAVF